MYPSTTFAISPKAFMLVSKYISTIPIASFAHFFVLANSKHVNIDIYILFIFYKRSGERKSDQWISCINLSRNVPNRTFRMLFCITIHFCITVQILKSIHILCGHKYKIAHTYTVWSKIYAPSGWNNAETSDNVKYIIAHQNIFN